MYTYFEKLSDLAHIPRIKGIVARIDDDAGVDSVENRAVSDPWVFRTEVLELVKRIKFDSNAPFLLI